jgi:hypothetical protein
MVHVAKENGSCEAPYGGFVWISSHATYAREMNRRMEKMCISRRPRRGSVPRAMPMEGTNITHAAFSLELLSHRMSVL